MTPACNRASWLFLAAALLSRNGVAACPEIPLLRFDADPAVAREAGCESVHALSYVPTGETASSYASFGGEIRERYDHINNPNFGADPDDPHGAWLQRFAAHADLRWHDSLRAFVELQSVLENGRARGPSPTDENQLAVQNAFVEARLPATPGADVRLRLGRQELQLGSARLVSVRDGPNVRRTFDGVRVLAHLASWNLNAIVVRPREDEPGAFDDSTSDSQALWGLYATRSLGAQAASALDVYYLGYRNDDATYDQGTAEEKRHTIGTRFFGSRGPWRWNVEPMVQFGEFGGADLRGWTIASETSYTWSGRAWSPRLTLSANIASGDRDPLDPDLQTFNPLYPRGNYFSEDATLWPQNFYNGHLFLTVHPTSTWALTADYDFFWRMSDDDGVYGPNGSLVRSGQGSDERLVATTLSITSEWSVSRNLSFTAIYTHSSPRAFLEQTGPADAIEFMELTARYRF